MFTSTYFDFCGQGAVLDASTVLCLPLFLKQLLLFHFFSTKISITEKTTPKTYGICHSSRQRQTVYLHRQYHTLYSTMNSHCLLRSLLSKDRFISTFNWYWKQRENMSKCHVCLQSIVHLGKALEDPMIKSPALF